MHASEVCHILQCTALHHMLILMQFCTGTISSQSSLVELCVKKSY